VVERLIMSVSSEPADVGACAKVTSQTTTATIDGKPFVVTKTSATQGSSITDTTVYQVLRNRTCFEVRDAVTYSSNTHLTAAELEQQRQNLKASAALMGTIVQSYKVNY
jgi:hypothetical protein